MKCCRSVADRHLRPSALVCIVGGLFLLKSYEIWQDHFGFAESKLLKGRNDTSRVGIQQVYVHHLETDYGEQS